MLTGRLVGSSGGQVLLQPPDQYGSFSTLMTGWPTDYGMGNGSRAGGFSDEGNHVLVADHVADTIRKVPLTTAYDPTTDNWTSADALNHDDGTNVAMLNLGWNAVGSKVWYVDGFGGTNGRAYSISTSGYALTDAGMGTPVGGNIPTGSSITNESWGAFVNDGSTFFLSGTDGVTAYLSQWDCGTAYDITTGTYQAEITLSEDIRSMVFDDATSGRGLYFSQNRNLYELTFTDKFDVTTYTETATVRNCSADVNPIDGDIGQDPDGNLYFWETTGTYRIRKLSRS